MELIYALIFAFLLSTFTSMSGISGAFLILPFQILVLGNISPSASSTNQFYNIVATPSGVLQFFREKRLFFPLVKLLCLATFPGVLVGAFARIYIFADAGSFKIFAISFLIILLFFILYNAKSGKKRKAPGSAKPKIIEQNRKFVRFEFDNEIYQYSTIPVFIVTALVSIMSGIYGIGGAVILAPFLTSICKLPVHVTAGATLTCTFFTSLVGVLIFTFLAPFYPELSIRPDFLLGLSFGIGGLLGMNTGARLQKYVRPIYIHMGIFFMVLFTVFIWIFS